MRKENLVAEYIDKLIKKLNGFQTAPRNRFFLLSMGILTTEEFVLYELGLALADWDESHREIYGTFDLTNGKLARLLGWRSDSTVSRHKKSLIEKGLFFEINGRISPKHFEKWVWQKNKSKERQGYLAEMQAEVAKMQDGPANLQESSAKMQDNQSQNRPIPLASYKDDLVSSPTLINKTSDQLTNEELLQIFPGATITEVRYA